MTSSQIYSSLLAQKARPFEHAPIPVGCIQPEKGPKSQIIQYETFL
jgi:hypothetical protein